MKLVNADKYKKDIEHYRNTICYQRNVTMDDCMRILDKQENVLDKIRAEIVELTKCPYGTECLGANCPSNTDCMLCGDHVLQIIDEYRAGK